MLPSRMVTPLIVASSGPVTSKTLIGIPALIVVSPAPWPAIVTLLTISSGSLVRV